MGTPGRSRSGGGTSSWVERRKWNDGRFERKKGRLGRKGGALGSSGSPGGGVQGGGTRSRRAGPGEAKSQIGKESLNLKKPGACDRGPAIPGWWERNRVFSVEEYSGEGGKRNLEDAWQV